MSTITLNYYFGEDQDLFEYEVEVNYSDYINRYLDENYTTVKGAVEDLAKDGLLDDAEVKEALKCKSLDDLADFIDDDTADTIVRNDNEFIEYFVMEDLKEENYDDAYEAFNESSGCDPDGFHGWGEYHRWKNG